MDDFLKRNKLTLMCIWVIVGVVGFLTLVYLALGTQWGAGLIITLTPMIVIFVFFVSVLKHAPQQVNNRRERYKNRPRRKAVHNSGPVVKVYNNNRQ